MRAMVFDRYGDPNVMSLWEVPVPEPQHGEVLIRVGYAGVNPSDTKARSGQATSRCHPQPAALRKLVRRNCQHRPPRVSLGADRVIECKNEAVCQAVRGWSTEGVDVVLDAVGPATLPQALDMLRPTGRLVNILTATADGDFERAQESMQEITNLVDCGSVHVPPINVLPLEDAIRAHQTIETGTAPGKTGPQSRGPWRLIVCAR
jgi:NADPH:quinone reductase-like Zn-dependent oxidoreductase